MSFLQSQQLKLTAFNETVTGSRSSVINIKPTWGVSVIRDDTSGTTGAGAGVDELNGEIRLQTGTSANNIANIRTLQRGQYRAGMTGEVGIGVRIPTAPTGTQNAQWGYFDSLNGLGFGCDSTGVYTFYKTGGSTTTYYQSTWNVDTMDGSANANNPSGLTFSLSQGNIFQIEFVWYGYGTIRFYISMIQNNIRTRLEVHRINVLNSISVVDPNQPITVQSSNGASSTSNFTVYLAGRQFSLFGGDVVTQTRAVSDFISNFTITAAQNTWQPLIAIRMKATFGPSNRTNSVRAIWTGYQMLCNNPCEFMVTTGALTSGTPSTWAAPTDWTSSESAIEVKIQTGSLTASGTNYTVGRSILGSSGTKSSTLLTAQSSIPMGAIGEFILWVRRTTTTATVVSAVMEWEEQW